MRAHTTILPFLLLLTLPSCRCSEKETDEERLKRKIDNFKVHVYVGAKATIADADSEELKALRETLITLATKAKGGDSAGTPEPGKLSLPELGKVAKHVLRLRKRGAKLVRKGEDHPPILPVLLGDQWEKMKGYDSNTEHNIIMAVFVTAKFHPKSPVPIPDELLLYEAARAEPSRGPASVAAAPLHAARAYVFARNELCDLALKETEAVFAAPNAKEQFQAVLTFVARRGVSAKQTASFAAGLEGLSHGAVALCYVKRDEPDKAKQPLGKMLDASEKVGVRGGEVGFLRAYLECSEDKDKARQGIARLDKLASSKDLPKYLRGDIDTLKDYCKTSAGTSSKLLRKIALSRMSIRLAMRHAEQSGLTEGLSKNDGYRSIGRLGAVARALTKGGEKLGGVKDKARGLMKRLKE